MTNLNTNSTSIRLRYFDYLLYVINNESVQHDLYEKHRKEVQYQDHIFEDFQVYELIFELFQIQKIKTFLRLY